MFGLRLPILFFVGLLGAASLSAQRTPRLFEASLIYGTPVKHSPELTFEVNQPSYGMRFAHYWQTNGKQEWQIRHGYPRLGVAAMWMQLGEKDILGSAFSIAPEISMPLITSNRYELRSTFGYGLGILTQSYDYLENPTNNAISAAINVSVQIKFDQLIRINPNWQALIGGAFTHFSNGARHLPNFGINVANVQLGLQYSPTVFDRTAWPTEIIKYERRDNFAFDLQVGLGYREREENRGPAYPIYTTSAALVYHLSTIQKMRLGFSWEKNRGVYVFGRHILLFNSVEEAAQKSQRRMIFYAHEFRFGPIGTNFWIGTYLAKDKSALLPGNVFNTIEIRYYLPRWKSLGMDAYFAFDMKSHKTRAEYISFRLGAMIGRNPQ